LAFWNGWFSGGQQRRDPGVQSLTPSSGLMTKRTVNDDTALQISAVFACVRRISETMASLPLEFYRVKKDRHGEILSREIELEHPLCRLLRYKPNRYQDRVQFFETVFFQLAFRGNSYCLITRDSKGNIVSLLPLMTSQVEVSLNENGFILYRYSSGNKIITYTEDNIWHMKLFGNGIVGLSPLDQARNTLGIAISAEDRVNRMANNGFKLAGVLSIDKILKKEQRQSIKENFNDIASGEDEALKVLEAGMKFTPTSMTPEDVQLLESRKFQMEDIARFFDVPPVLIHDMSSSTIWGSGITEIVRGFYKLSLSSYRERTKTSIAVQLFEPGDRETIEIEYDSDELLRGNEKERYEGYKIGISSGILSPNDARKLEGLKPDPDGNNLFIDRQLILLKNGGKDESKTPAA
jgi:HK97 family phage portal protein